MAESGDYTRGDMEVVEHVKTFSGVMGLVKWGSLTLAVLLTALILWYCTPTGFIQTAGVTLILLVAGVWFLSRKPSGH